MNRQQSRLTTVLVAAAAILATLSWTVLVASLGSAIHP